MWLGNAFGAVLLFPAFLCEFAAKSGQQVELFENNAIDIGTQFVSG